jgi:L-ascorbate metabolism protein UlaG (beta-lactamase superfamily)
MLRKAMSIILLCLLALALISCGGQETKSGDVAGTGSPAESSQPTVDPTPAQESTAPAESESPSPTVRPGYSTSQTIFPVEMGDGKRHPIIENDTGMTLIQTVSKNDYYPTTYMLVTKSGKIVVMDPRDMPSQDMLQFKPDVITITHGHQDHNDAGFINAFDDTAKILQYRKTEDLTLDDIRVYSVLSDHVSDSINAESPTNMIFVYEVDGLRIANLGDIGQSKLNDEQLEQIGKIDILITQLENSFSSMYYNRDTKAKDIIQQLNPKILIPTHGGDLYADDIAEYLGAEYEVVDTILAVDAASLADSKQKVVRIAQHQKY